jgi:hypothetical protein
MWKHFRKNFSTYFYLGRRSSFPWVFIVAVLVFFLVLWFASYLFLSRGDVGSVQPRTAFELLVVAVGAAAAFVHFLYTQHYQGTQMFVSLFEKFNKRYDDLNEKLNDILSRDTGSPFGEGQVNTLYDYFNLCAEEHLFYESGYIDERVWQAWLRGMKYFAKDSGIRLLWEREIASGSYYQFNLLLLDAIDFKNDEV